MDVGARPMVYLAIATDYHIISFSTRSPSAHWRNGALSRRILLPAPLWWWSKANLLMKWLLLILIILAILWIAHSLTTVRTTNNRLSISTVYCKLAGPATTTTQPVIIVPGILGSILTQQGHTRWLTLRHLLPSKSLTYTGEVFDAPRILDRITIIPFLLEYRPYYRIAAQAACLPNAYAFPYDWRAFPDDNAKKLEELVDRVIAQTGMKPSIVAHSMGGLIAHSVVKEHPEKFNKIVYVTVPFDPGIGYLDDLNDGASIGLNKTIRSREVIFSNPSSFLLLSHKGIKRFRDKDMTIAKSWEEEHWSVFADRSVDLAAFQKTLDRVTAYHGRLDRPTTITNPTLFVVGNCHGTVWTEAPDHTRTYVKGDGRVSEQSAFPKDTFASKQTLNTCITHTKQLNDLGLVNKILEFI